jgi:hypothetical protein
MSDNAPSCWNHGGIMRPGEPCPGCIYDSQMIPFKEIFTGSNQTVLLDEAICFLVKGGYLATAKVIAEMQAAANQAVQVIEAADVLAREVESYQTGHLSCLRSSDTACGLCRVLAEFKEARRI